MGSQPTLINLEQISRNACVHWKIEEFECFQYLDRLLTVELLVAAADGATDLRMGHDQLCMRLQVKWGNVPEMAAVGSDCCIHFLLYLWEGSMYTASFMKEQN